MHHQTKSIWRAACLFWESLVLNPHSSQIAWMTDCILSHEAWPRSSKMDLRFCHPTRSIYNLSHLSTEKAYTRQPRTQPDPAGSRSDTYPNLTESTPPYTSCRERSRTSWGKSPLKHGFWWQRCPALGWGHFHMTSWPGSNDQVLMKDYIHPDLEEGLVYVSVYSELDQ